MYIPVENEEVEELTEDSSPSHLEPYLLQGSGTSPFAAFESADTQVPISRAPSLSQAPSRTASPGIAASLPGSLQQPFYAAESIYSI